MRRGRSRRSSSATNDERGVRASREPLTDAEQAQRGDVDLLDDPFRIEERRSRGAPGRRGRRSDRVPTRAHAAPRSAAPAAPRAPPGAPELVHEGARARQSSRSRASRLCRCGDELGARHLLGSDFHRSPLLRPPRLHRQHDERRRGSPSLVTRARIHQRCGPRPSLDGHDRARNLPRGPRSRQLLLEQRDAATPSASDRRRSRRGSDPRPRRASHRTRARTPR